MNIVAVLGSYRKDGVNDRIVRAVAEGARESGANVDVLFLRDIQFAYCKNCRTCWDPAVAGAVGNCPIDDDLTPWIKRIAAADGLILGSPVNLGLLTAVFKKFAERCVALAVMTPAPRLLRWLMHLDAFPACRAKRAGRTMVWVTGSMAPAFWARLLMKGPKAQFRAFRDMWPARLVDFLWVGGVMATDWKLPDEQLCRARRAGAKMVHLTTG